MSARPPAAGSERNGLTVAGTQPERASDGGRVIALDALRGLAVAGIVPMNVLVFAMPGAAYVNPAAYGGTGPVETALWAAVFILIEDKFRNLFAMLFGAGVAMLLARDVEHPLLGHYARMAVLFVIGFAHATLLANNDILRLYAMTGLVVPFFAGMKPRTLLVLAALLVAGQLAVAGYFTWGWLDYWWRWHTGAVGEFGPLVRAERVFGADPDTIAFALERGGETFAQRLDRRLEAPLAPLQTALVAIPSTLAAMLVGIALWRGGLLAGTWRGADMMRLARWSTAVSLPALAAMAGFSAWSGFSAVVTAGNALVWSAPFDLLLAIGWAALFMAIFGERADQRFVRRLAAAGRMALTNYLATSLLFAAIFASWGLGLFGQLGRIEATALGLLPITLMLWWSPLWLRHFRQGPLEWLWRSASGAKVLPFRRRGSG